MNVDFILMLVIVGLLVLAVVALLVWRHLVAPLREFRGLETRPAHVVSARVRVTSYEVLRGSLAPTEIGVSLTYWDESGPRRAEVWAEPGKVPAAVRAKALGEHRSESDGTPPRTPPTPIADASGAARAKAEDASRANEVRVAFEPPLEASVFLSDGRVVSWELTKGRGWHLRGQ